MFISYLWGIETDDEEFITRRNELFISYLWGIETEAIDLSAELEKRLYLTYEELKPP